MFRLVSASRLRNVYCLNLAFLRSILVEKMIHPVIFDTDSFKRLNSLRLSKKSSQLFIKISMVRRSRLIIFTSRKSSVTPPPPPSVFRHASASRLRDVYCLKGSEDLVENIVSPVIFDTNRSFKR